MSTQTQEAWRFRVAMLALSGALAGFAIHILVPDDRIFGSGSPVAVWRMTLATFLLAAGLAFGLTWERRRFTSSLGFAAVAGVVVAAVIAFNGAPGTWGGGVGFRLPAAALAVLIAAPVFQVARDHWQPHARPSIPYRQAHAAAWTDVVLLGAAGLFVLLVWALAWLLAGLFDLIGLDLLRRLLERDGAFWVVSGCATGAGLGLLKDRAGILDALRNALMLVFRVLAPVLAMGFVIFVGSLPFTGLSPLWQATKATTPLMLTACVVALIALNMVVANGPDEEAKGHPLRWSAIALALVIAPFAVIATVSTGLRIGQHGLSPDRMWAVVLDGVAVAYACGMIGALLRGRVGGWMPAVRTANLRLTLGLCGLAVLLSTPLVGFDAISARDQVARLRSGQISPERFDWAAIRFDFGPPGRRALAELSRSPDRRLAEPARRALAATSMRNLTVPALTAPPLAVRLRIRPPGTSIDPAIVAAIEQKHLCDGAGGCLVIARPGGATIVYGGSSRLGDAPSAHALERRPTGWSEGGNLLEWFPVGEQATAFAGAVASGRIELRPVERHQLYLEGKPVGGVLP